MVRSFSSVALTVLVTIALLWGNCAQCTALVSVASQPAQRDCCDQPSTTDCHQKPAPKQQCTFSSTDLAKALVDHQQHHAAPVLVADRSEIAHPPVISPIEHRGAAVPSYSPPDLCILNSAFLI